MQCRVSFIQPRVYRRSDQQNTFKHPRKSWSPTAGASIIDNIMNHDLIFLIELLHYHVSQMYRQMLLAAILSPTYERLAAHLGLVVLDHRQHPLEQTVAGLAQQHG